MYAKFLQSLGSSYNSDKIQGSPPCLWHSSIYSVSCIQTANLVQWWASLWPMKYDHPNEFPVGSLFVFFESRVLLPSLSTHANLNTLTLQAVAALTSLALQRPQNQNDECSWSRCIESLSFSPFSLHRHHPIICYICLLGLYIMHSGCDGSGTMRGKIRTPSNSERKVMV
jgi:hypothetical protein